MAEGDARLPSELYGEGEKKSIWGDGHGFPCEFPYDMDSDHLSSSVSSRTETESDNDDFYLDGLTRQMAHSFLLDDDDNTDPKVSAIMAFSPQSTLCGMRRWPFSGPSGTISPNGRSLSSSVAAPAEEQVALMRLRAQAEAGKLYGSIPLDTFSKNHDIAQQQPKVKIQQQQLRKQQRAWARQSKVGGAAEGGAKRCRPLGLSPSAWPPLRGQHPPMVQQEQAQSGGRRMSTGTGVFLPQRNENHAESRKKPARTAVLLPARVVQALNLNMEDMGLHPHLPGTYVLDHDALLSRGNALKRGQLLRQKPRSPVAAADPH